MPLKFYSNILVMVSYDKLIDVLSSSFEENRILSINKNLLSSVVDLMKQFVPIFDSLEFSKAPTIHIVVPSYYAMTNMVQLNGQERPAVKILKESIQRALDEKYVTHLIFSNKIVFMTSISSSYSYTIS